MDKLRTKADNGKIRYFKKWFRSEDSGARPEDSEEMWEELPTAWYVPGSWPRDVKTPEELIPEVIERARKYQGKYMLKIMEEAASEKASRLHASTQAPNTNEEGSSLEPRAQAPTTDENG